MFPIAIVIVAIAAVLGVFGLLRLARWHRRRNEEKTKSAAETPGHSTD